MAGTATTSNSTMIPGFVSVRYARASAKLLPDPTVCLVKSLDPLFWLESIVIVAFGVSWSVKGEAILRDEI